MVGVVGSVDTDTDISRGDTDDITDTGSKLRGAGVIPPLLATNRLRLRPCSPNDLPMLYAMATSDELFWRWRFGGTIPTYDTFCQSFSVGVLTQFTVCSLSSNDPIGLVVAYSPDIPNGTCYIAAMMQPNMLRTGMGIEAMYLFIMYIFKTWDLYKLYLEVLEFNIDQFASGIDRYFHQEACYKKHHYYDGKRWDQYVYGLYRDEFLSHPTVVRYGTHIANIANLTSKGTNGVHNTKIANTQVFNFIA